MDYLKHTLDVITGGNFLEIDELESLRIINGLVVFPVDEKTDGKLDRLDKIENILCGLNLNGIEKSSKNYQIHEIDGYWEPTIKMRINEFDYNALCDLGASISVMPKSFNEMLNFIFWKNAI